MSIFRIPASSPNAASRTVEKAEQARVLGYTDVRTGFEPAHDGHAAAHIVTGTAPRIPDAPGR